MPSLRFSRNESTRVALGGVIAAMNGLRIIALLALLVCAGCSDKRSDPGSDAKVLVVGMDPTYPPFEMRDPSGELSGVSVDLGRSLGEHLGHPVEIRAIDFQGLIPALKSGKVDLIISSMTRTDERAKSVLFSEPYVANGLCLLVSTESNVKDIADLNQKGRKVVVRTGTTGHIYARKALENAELLPQELVETCVAEVRNGNVDAFLYDQLSVLAYAEKYPDKLKALPKPFQIEYWSIAMAPGNDDLKEKVDEFLVEWQSSDGPAEAIAKYPELSRRAEQMQQSGQAFVFDVSAARE